MIETKPSIISEYSKLAQKYKTRHDWVGKVIHWRLCKEFKVNHTNKWYMHNPASVLENDTHKFRWDFDIQTGLPNLGQKTRPYNNQQNKRTCKIVYFAVPADHGLKLKEYEQKDKYLDPLGN